VTRRCQDCSTAFDGEHWQRLCWPCWRQRKQSDELDRAYHRGWLDGLAADGKRASYPSVDPRLIERAIRLCHPDRHPGERFTETNDVTAQLLTARGRPR